MREEHTPQYETWMNQQEITGQTGHRRSEDTTLEKTVFLCDSVVEHCFSSAKGCGFDSQGTHILMKMYNLNAIVSRFG